MAARMAVAMAAIGVAEKLARSHYRGEVLSNIRGSPRLTPTAAAATHPRTPNNGLAFGFDGVGSYCRSVCSPTPNWRSGSTLATNGSRGTGISERHIAADDEWTSDLACATAVKALKRQGARRRY